MFFLFIIDEKLSIVDSILNYFSFDNSPIVCEINKQKTGILIAFLMSRKHRVCVQFTNGLGLLYLESG